MGQVEALVRRGWGVAEPASEEAIVNAAKTGKVGDGKIFVTTIDQVWRIRTGETQSAAL